MRMLLRDTVLRTVLVRGWCCAIPCSGWCWCEDAAARLRGPDFGPLIFCIKMDVAARYPAADDAGVGLLCDTLLRTLLV